MEFQRKMTELQSLVEKTLGHLFLNEYPSASIVHSINYSLTAGGKRVRPILAIAICDALGGDINEIVGVSAAIECIHTYSLIHDDLPAMDNDCLRRGKPTNHVVFGEANAILAGDGLLNFAYELLLQEIIRNKFETRFVKAAELIATCAGINGMIAGQVMDMENETKKISVDELYKMHSMKTGALIKASCMAGALIAEREELYQTVETYSEHIGIAFQIIDDILDYTGNEITLGKSIGSDRENQKATFVTLLGLEESKQLAQNHSTEALKYAEKIDHSGFLADFTRYLLNRQN